jgi:ketosteroid isomerase-like protein
MNIEQNKALAREFFARFSANDIPGVLDMLADDVSWWSAGKPDLVPVTGVRNKERIARVFNGMLAQLKNGLEMAVKGMTAEGDKVAVEVESRGELQNGRVYNNEYHFLMTLRDGKISAVKEYYDTHHVHATWFQA